MSLFGGKLDQLAYAYLIRIFGFFKKIISSTKKFFSVQVYGSSKFFEKF